MQTLVLIENDDRIISDIKCSLDLIGVSLVHAQSLNDCKSAVDEHEPPLILARIGKQLQDSEGFSKSVRDNGRLFGVPVTVLGTETELSVSREQGINSFAELKLPVEFPQFTYDVQRIMADALGSVQEGSVVSEELSSSEADDKPASDVSTGASQKYALLIKLYNQVLSQLVDNGVIDELELEDIPRVLADETRMVCEKFSVNEDKES